MGFVLLWTNRKYSCIKKSRLDVLYTQSFSPDFADHVAKLTFLQFLHCHSLYEHIFAAPVHNKISMERNGRRPTVAIHLLYEQGVLTKEIFYLSASRRVSALKCVIWPSNKIKSGLFFSFVTNILNQSSKIFVVVHPFLLQA